MNAYYWKKNQPNTNVALLYGSLQQILCCFFLVKIEKKYN